MEMERNWKIGIQSGLQNGEWKPGAIMDNDRRIKESQPSVPNFNLYRDGAGGGL